MSSEILWEAKKFKTQIGQLKEKALIFPAIYTESTGGVYWATSLVDFYFESRRYRRHVVESIILNEYAKDYHCINRLRSIAENTIKHGLPTDQDEEIK